MAVALAVARMTARVEYGSSASDRVRLGLFDTCHHPSAIYGNWPLLARERSNIAQDNGLRVRLLSATVSPLSIIYAFCEER
jgi:hypothetical protein